MMLDLKTRNWNGVKLQNFWKLEFKGAGELASSAEKGNLYFILGGTTT